MYWRLLGVVLLSLSLIVGGISAARVKSFNRVESFIIEDRVVWVPPWNSSEGWVGFNSTLPNRWKPDYEVFGIVLPNDGDRSPKMVMRVVNETGLSLLRFDQFDPSAWNSTKIYAAAFLDKTQRVSTFKFLDMDNSSRFFFLFRGLKNETESRPILLNLKEAWSQENILLEPTPLNMALIAVTAVLGLIAVVRSLQNTDKRSLRRHT